MSAKATTPNARFWFGNEQGDFRVTLRPGQTIRLTDERPGTHGTDRMETQLTHSGDRIDQTFQVYVAQPDGPPVPGHGSCFCRLDRLAARCWLSATDKRPILNAIYGPEWSC